MRWASSIALAWLATAAVARADGAPTLAVRVAPTVPTADAARFVSAIRAQLGSDAVVVEDRAGASLVVDVDRTPGGFVVRFGDAGGRATGEPRRVAGSGEIGASEIATIVRAFVVARRETTSAPTSSATDADAARPSASEAPAPDAPAAMGAAGPAPAPTAGGAVPRTTEPRDAPATARVRPWRVRIGAFYTGTSYAGPLPWQSGARIEAAVAVGPGFYGGLGYAFLPPSEIARDGASVRLVRHVGTAFVGVESRGPTWCLGADLGGGLTDTVRTTTTTSAAFAATPDSASFAPIFALRVHGRYRVPQSHGLALDLAPAFELAPGDRDLVVATGGGATVLVSPSAARARLDVGVTFDGF